MLLIDPLFIVESKEIPEWWNNLNREEQLEYRKIHPHSELPIKNIENYDENINNDNDNDIFKDDNFSKLLNINNNDETDLIKRRLEHSPNTIEQLKPNSESRIQASGNIKEIADNKYVNSFDKNYFSKLNETKRITVRNDIKAFLKNKQLGIKSVKRLSLLNNKYQNFLNNSNVQKKIGYSTLAATGGIIAITSIASSGILPLVIGLTPIFTVLYLGDKIHRKLNNKKNNKNISFLIESSLDEKNDSELIKSFLLKQSDMIKDLNIPLDIISKFVKIQE